MKHFLARKLLVVGALMMLVTQGGASSLPLPVPEATASITARGLKRHLSFLASDELGGRYTFSAGNRIAARYLASQLESYGYRGGARDKSFFQKVPVSTRKIDLGASVLTLGTGQAKQVFKYGDDFVSQAPTEIGVSGELVFAGHGVSSPKNNYDDYAGLDVKGKMVVVAGGEPAALRGVRLPDKEQGEAAAADHGAAAVIVIATQQTIMEWTQIKFSVSGEVTGLPPKSVAGKSVTSIVAGPALIKALASLIGKDSAYLIAASGKPMEPMKLSTRADLKIAVQARNNLQAQNVVGILDGADAKLRDEYVVFSAHYDHLETSPRGEVYNGADDDGSGTVSVLEIAHALTVGPRPKRSILIVFHTGEELGLLGSEFNTDYEPVVPLEKLVADFNVDMVGRSRPEGDLDARDKELTDKDSLYVIGADKLSSELSKLSEQTNAETARMRFDLTYNDENHPQRFYYRSDHYHYAKHGIPIIFYFTGVHRDYHRTTDDVDKIDFDKMERIDRLIFATGWRVANLDHRLVVDKKP